MAVILKSQMSFLLLWSPLPNRRCFSHWTHFPHWNTSRETLFVRITSTCFLISCRWSLSVTHSSIIDTNKVCQQIA